MVLASGASLIASPDPATAAPLPPLPISPAPPAQSPPAAAPPTAIPGPAPARSGSATVGVDPAHTGAYTDPALVPPLARRWSRPSTASHVLVSGGAVLAQEIGRLVAYDLRSGRTLWKRRLTPFHEPAALEGTRVFIADSEETVALDVRTGRPLWRVAEGSEGPLVADGGILYSTRAGGLRASSTSTGATVWTALGLDGSGAPAVDADRVYLAGACGVAAAYDRQTGRRLWHRDAGCSGGGDVTPTLYRGLLYVPDSYNDPSTGEYGAKPIYRASTGKRVGGFEADQPVALDARVIFARSLSTSALSAASLRPLWRVRATLANPLASNHDIYGFGIGGLVARDAERGQRLWSAHPPRNLDARPYSPVLAAGPDALLLSFEGRLSAYGSVLRPSPQGLALRVSPGILHAGGRADVVGVAGERLRVRRPRVRIQGAEWPRGRWRAAGGARVRRDGGFADRNFRIYRNARFRAAVGSIRSRAFTVYAYPRVRLGRPVRHAGRVTVSVRARAPRTSLRGRRFVLYLDRSGSGPLRRLAVGRLRGRGPGRVRTTLTFRLPRLGRRDRVAYCVKGQLRLRLGKPSPLTRRCGARLISGK